MDFGFPYGQISKGKGRQHHVQEVHFTSIGTSQGSVLHLCYILYTLYFSRSRYPGRHVIKFADDTALVILIKQDEVEHGLVLNDFVN